ncbi:MAG: hypothetical protein WCH98_03205 [Verrucomicrobiota bacterium]
MDKLYYIVCEEKGEPLFEGRFQGRTRGAAIKFLKDQIGRPGLNGTVFTITEIPVPLIREIVEAIMKGEPVLTEATVATAEANPKKVVRFDAFEQHNQHPVEDHNLDNGPEKPEIWPAKGTDWKAVKRFYSKCRSPKQTAEEFRLSVNTVKTRIRREEWK